jgi:hypothetical protein
MVTYVLSKIEKIAVYAQLNDSKEYCASSLEILPKPNLLCAELFHLQDPGFKNSKLRGLKTRANYADQRQPLFGEVSTNFCE